MTSHWDRHICLVRLYVPTGPTPCAACMDTLIFIDHDSTDYSSELITYSALTYTINIMVSPATSILIVSTMKYTILTLSSMNCITQSYSVWNYFIITHTCLQAGCATASSIVTTVGARARTVRTSDLPTNAMNTQL